VQSGECANALDISCTIYFLGGTWHADQNLLVTLFIPQTPFYTTTLLLQIPVASPSIPNCVFRWWIPIRDDGVVNGVFMRGVKRVCRNRVSILLDPYFRIGGIPDE
jgi:hypothetical protein